MPTVTAAVAKNNLITFVQPDYPPLAKATSIVGKVRAEIIVDESGNVASVKLLSGHPMLAPSALVAIRKWKYRPFEVDGRPTRIRTEVEVSIPERIDEDDQAREKKFQEVFWPNQKAGQEAFDKNDLSLAESKLIVARSAAEQRGEQKWLELCGVVTLLGHIKLKQNDYAAAENLYKESLALHEKHQRPDEAEVAGAQQSLGLLYVRIGRPNDAEPLYRKSVATYEARIKDIDLPEPQAAYGRHLALGYFALAQIARSDHRQHEAREFCQKAVDFAQRWSDLENRKVIVAACDSLVTLN
ncbi:MAG: TonB family protein [Terriglobales bacterium]